MKQYIKKHWKKALVSAAVAAAGYYGGPAGAEYARKLLELLGVGG